LVPVPSNQLNPIGKGIPIRSPNGARLITNNIILNTNGMLSTNCSNRIIMIGVSIANPTKIIKTHFLENQSAWEIALPTLEKRRIVITTTVNAYIG